MRVAGARVLVTGASSGIGAATAIELARRGARVVIAARRRQELDQIAMTMREAGAEADTHVVDLADEDRVWAMVAAAQKTLGGLDILINNAGIGLHADVRDISVEDLGYVFQVNVLAPHVATLAALPEMLAHRRGHIVNVGSVASHVSAPHMGGYAASKFALKALSDSLRSELKGSGVGVTLVCPGPVKTMFAANVRGAETSYLPRRPLGAPVEGCANAIVQGIERGTAEVFYPGYWQGLVGANAMFPQFMRAFGAAFVRRGARILGQRPATLP